MTLPNSMNVRRLVTSTRSDNMPRVAHQGWHPRNGSIVRALVSGIPALSAEGAALFRLVFGTAVVMLFAVLSPIGSINVPRGPLSEDAAWLTRILEGVFVARPELADYINAWLLISGVLFVAGALTRLSFAAFALGTIAWGTIYSMQSGHHPISALLVAMLCLIPSRWGDAWSLDAWLRHRRTRAAPREYGYSVWIPGVVLGIALAGAAASKLREGGLGWIINGTVKYHFVTDAASAPVDWGLRFGVIPSVAIALSFGAIAIETLVLPAAAIGAWRIRLLAAIATIGMLLGFWLFQGLFWPSWWVLVLSLLPWDRLPVARASENADPESPRLSRLSLVQVATVIVVAAQQVVASMERLEVPPLVSAYDMYSRTYDSPADYPSDGGSTHWVVATFSDHSQLSCRIGRDEAEMLATLSPGNYTDDAKQTLASCFGDRQSIETLTFEERRPNIDWAAGRYLGTIHIPIGKPVVFASS
jgi:hypothetical protein